jgi:hypothetical protein
MTLIQIQDKQVAAELKAYAKHGKSSPVTRTVIFAARTRARKAIIALGFSYEQACDAVADAADMVSLKRSAEGAKGVVTEVRRLNIDEALTAAAPDLLSALRRILTAGNRGDMSWKENRDEFDAAITAGWNAIAKAEGREGAK